MLDPYELQELGKERQQALIAWRENRRKNRRLLGQPLPGSTVITIPRRVINAIISKLESLGQTHTAALTSAARIRRG
jgi:hypothetical protein